jgi:dihydrofolate reductase
VYSVIASVDGYTEDAAGRFDWAAPTEDVHAFVNEQERPIGTYLYGRRMYETMQYWATAPTTPDPAAGGSAQASPVTCDYARIWQAADKVVYSTSFAEVTTPRTRLERSFDAEVVRSLVAGAPSDVSIGGPTVAAAALRAGLVDEVSLLLVPVAVGAGKPVFPPDQRVDLALQDHRRFDDGTVFLRYRVTGR